MHIFIDIETIPDQSPDARVEIAATIKPPGTLKKTESIAEWERDSKPAAVEEAYLKTSFDGGAGQVICIGFAVDDEPPQVFHAPDTTRDAERWLLGLFFEELRSLHGGGSGRVPRLVGHNHAAFDLPFLAKRCIVQGVKPPIWWPRSPKPWSESVYDTMVEWAGVKERISMDRLCKILGIPGKEGVDGSMVWPLVQAGEIEKVAEYCGGDVMRTREIFKRMQFL